MTDGCSFEELNDDDFKLESLNFQNVKLASGKNARVYYSKLTEEAQNVVFVHGFNFCCDMYAPFLRILAQEYNVLTFDLPGHGKTDFFESYDLEVFYDYIAEIVAYFKLQRYVMVGHSMGGLITLSCSQLAQFSTCVKFVAFAPAGVQIIESANQKFGKSKCGGCLATTCTSIAMSKTNQETEYRSLSRMPDVVARNLRQIRDAMSTHDRIQGTSRRIVYYVYYFPWNALFNKDMNNERIRVVLAQNDAYVDFAATYKVMPRSIVLQTIHENCIVCPYRCASILREFLA